MDNRLERLVKSHDTCKRMPSYGFIVFFLVAPCETNTEYGVDLETRPLQYLLG
jgi:hypothetical protein